MATFIMEAFIMDNDETFFEDFQRESANYLIQSMTSDMKLLMSYDYPQTKLVKLLAKDLESAQASIQVLLAMAGYKIEF